MCVSSICWRRGVCLPAIPLSPRRSSDPSRIAAALSARGAASRTLAISPDGTKVAYIWPGAGPGDRGLRRRPRPAPSHTRSRPSTAIRETLDWCELRRERPAGLPISAAIAAMSTGDLVGFSRLIALDTDGKRREAAGPAASDQRRSAYARYDGTVIDWLPGENGAVLMDARLRSRGRKDDRHRSATKEGLGVDRDRYCDR